MNFTDLTDDLSIEFGLTKQLSRKIITFLIKKLREKIVFGIEVSFRNIGTFRLKIRQPKPFLHLKTGNTEMSKKSFYLNFRPTLLMKEKLKTKTVH